MLKQTKKAFTLVELIIVITILAILATIGFMSYQSYTMDARDGKRSTDISSLQSKLEVTVAKNASLVTSFASGSANTLSWSSKTIAWTWLINLFTASKYQAWDVKYDSLWVSSLDFSDPGTAKSPYKFGWAITSSGSMYQFAATLEWGDSWKKAIVKWLFLKWSSDTAEWLIMASGSTSAWTWVIDAGQTYFPY